MTDQQRARQLANNYRQVMEAIAAAAQDCSAVRRPDSALPALTVVTKFFPSSDVEILYDLGVRKVGENRDQEAAAKAAALAQAKGQQHDLAWSFIGQLQSNKAKSVVRYASEVQSIDRLSLVHALGKAYARQASAYADGQAQPPAAASQGGLKCLIQVNLADSAETTQKSLAHPSGRGGAKPEDVVGLAEAISSYPGLKCAGVMAVAPLEANPEKSFEKLFAISQDLKQQFPDAQEISAGMSGDFESAIRWGSTNVRIGSQIMGKRPS
ncbi:MAG: YggS family pyridoxal phosphate-dependent enzyme [Rothia sp. (in: high G+C Gram-positive bacteria)]|nr:YggS family pyridoxal phosphate-dependent enzyme [Rothia sp. (in: high G+C Gram-positive bacteria)]